MTNYTLNIALDPGMQLGGADYQAVNNSSIGLGNIGSVGTLAGNPGLIVDTPGVITGEGIVTPSSPVQDNVNHTFSVYIQGTLPGTLTVSALANPGGIILGSAPVTLTTNGSWQRVVISNVPATTSQSLSLMITTNVTEATEFFIANVQIEESSTAHKYCDGGQQGCYWQTVVGGISFQPFQNTVGITTSNIINTSDVVNALIQGEAFNITVLPDTNYDYSNIPSTLFAPGPVGAMTDFSVAAITDPDPAQTYISWNNAGLTVPTSGYARSSGVFFPPQDYFVSNGQQLYSRAAYMSVGFQFSNVPNNQKVLWADVQAEIMPFTTAFGNVSASTYMLPRSVQTIIKPTRLNYCPNPSLETGLTGWSGVGAGTISQDTTIAGPPTGVFIDDVQQGISGASLKVTAPSSGAGAQITIAKLIAGDTYIVSAYVQAGANMTDIIMSCANGVATVAQGSGGSGYGSGTYGGGFYGGHPASSTVIPSGTWVRLVTTFQATDTTATLIFSGNVNSSTSFWVDSVLVEAGQTLGTYFDGSFGHNYFWETGGTIGQTRSYYYDQWGVKAQAVNNVLAHHTPYGISSATPLFNTPPTQ